MRIRGVLIDFDAEIHTEIRALAELFVRTRLDGEQFLLRVGGRDGEPGHEQGGEGVHESVGSHGVVSSLWRTTLLGSLPGAPLRAQGRPDLVVIRSQTSPPVDWQWRCFSRGSYYFNGRVRRRRGRIWRDRIKAELLKKWRLWADPCIKRHSP